MKVSLLGDSIRLIGYGKRVPELLGGGVTVYQPEENCRYARLTLRGIFEWGDELAGSDVIHWNNGLWDTATIFGDGEPFTPIDQYVETMVRIAELLLRITPHVIFATTTPVIEGQKHNVTERIKAYNAAVVPKLKAMGVKINDLYSLVASDPKKYIRDDDKIHLTDVGIEVAARQVADTIIEELGEKYTAHSPANNVYERDAALIVTDIEGISGVSTIDAIPTDSPLYREACEGLMRDTNAAIRALIDSGVGTVYVLDGHGNGQNFIKDKLDSRATQIRIDGLGDAVEKSSCVVLIGMHAKSGTLKAFLDHTQSSARIHRYYYNGHRIGEMDQMGFFAGYYGVPCVAVSGDEAACLEAKKVFPGIATAAVKCALSRNQAECIDADEAESRIYSAVREGFTHRAELAPYPARLPLTVEVEFHRADYADEAVALHPGLTRIDEFTVREVKTSVDGYLDVLILWG